jgi:hypothetical protein
VVSEPVAVPLVPAVPCVVPLAEPVTVPELAGSVERDAPVRAALALLARHAPSSCMK